MKKIILYIYKPKNIFSYNKNKIIIKRIKYIMNYKRNNFIKVYYLLKLIQLITENKLKYMIINKIS